MDTTVYDTHMSAKPIPVRLSEEDIHRLDDAAARLGLSSRSDLIKLAVGAMVNHIQKTGGLQLPADWKGILESMDGRTKKSASKKGR